MKPTAPRPALSKEARDFRKILRDPSLFDALINCVDDPEIFRDIGGTDGKTASPAQQRSYRCESREIMVLIYEATVEMWDDIFDPMNSPRPRMKIGEIFQKHPDIQGCGLEPFRDAIIAMITKQPEEKEFLNFMLGAFAAGWSECIRYQYWRTTP